MTPKLREILEYEDDPKPVPAVAQHVEQVTSLAERLKGSDFWERVAQHKEKEHPHA